MTGRELLRLLQELPPGDLDLPVAEPSVTTVRVGQNGPGFGGRRWISLRWKEVGRG